MVCDWGDNTVKVLSPDGTQLFLTISDPDHWIPFSAVSHQDIFVVSYYRVDNVKVFCNDGVGLYNIGTHGPGDGQLYYPTGLAVDRFSNLVVCDYGNSRIQIFTLDGKFVSKIQGHNTGLLDPRYVALSPTGQLCITDFGKHCVYVFQ